MGLKPEPPRTGRDYIGGVRTCYRGRIRSGAWGCCEAVLAHAAGWCGAWKTKEASH